MPYKIASLILTPPQKANYLSEVFISQPDAAKEALAGKLFALIEFESKKSSDLKIINFLINALNYDYYQNEKMIMRERLDSIKIEHIFESALAKTNKKFAEFLQNEKISFNPALASITVGVIYKDELYFTCHGKNKALLIFKQKMENDKEKFKLADISEKTSAGQNKKTSLVKLFSSVVNGQLPRGGYFILSNETLPEYLSAKQLIEITTTLPPVGAVEQIKNMLLAINAYVPFLAIIIKNTTGLEMSEIKKIPSKNTSKSSIDNLNSTEEVTEKLLTPTGVLKTKKWFAPFSSFFGSINLGKISGRDNKLFLLKDRVILKKRPAWLSLAKIFYGIKITFLWLAGFMIYLFKIITDKNKLNEVWQNSKNKFSAGILNIKNAAKNTIVWLRKLNKRNKILLAIASVCLLFFVQNLIWLSIKNTNTKKQDNFNAIIAAIEQKQNQIDASLLYNNEAGAKTILDEVSLLLAQLPNNSKEQKDLYNKLTAKNSIQLEKIAHVIKIEAPQEIANFSNLNQQAKPDNIILADGKIYSADQSQKSIYSLEINNKLITAITDLKQPISQLKTPVKISDNKIYYLNGKNLLELDATSEALAVFSLDASVNATEILDLKSYNSRLYLLLAKSGKIIRLTKSDSQFGNSFSWLSEKVDLSQAVSLDIDGSVYVLKNNGEILKFTKGKSENFSIALVEPALTKPTKILVSPEQKYIYIFEPANKRLVIFDKSGKFLEQYLINSFNDLKDFAVDETAKKIYFLNGASIYAIDGQHFGE